MMRIKQMIRSLLFRLGYQVVKIENVVHRSSPYGYEPWFIDSVISKIDFVIDAGANRGTFTTKVRASAFNNRLPALLVEPNPSLNEYLRRTFRDNATISSMALSDYAGVTEFEIAANDGNSSSILKMQDAHLNNAPHAGIVKKISVKTETLDNLTEGIAFEKALLKIDVQGAELLLLKGAKNTLKRTAAILVEMSYVELYENCAKAHEVEELLFQNGYRLMAIEPIFLDKDTQFWLQADGYFVHESCL